MWLAFISYLGVLPLDIIFLLGLAANLATGLVVYWVTLQPPHTFTRVQSTTQACVVWIWVSYSCSFAIWGPIFLPFLGSNPGVDLDVVLFTRVVPSMDQGDSGIFNERTFLMSILVWLSSCGSCTSGYGHLFSSPFWEEEGIAID